VDNALGADGAAPGGGRSARSRRRTGIVAAVAGVVVAVVLGVIVFSGAGTSSTPSPAGVVTGGGSAPVPGIAAQSAQLLDLDVLSQAQTSPAPPFSLVDQNGQPTSLAQLRGKVVVWTLSDDRCTDLCVLFAQDVVAADRDLGRAAAHVAFVSVNANPYYPSTATVHDWSVQNDLESLPNWEFLTGTPTQLQAVWSDYHVNVILDAKDQTVQHDTTIEFIDPDGRTRAVGDFANGSLDTAYYAHTMAQMADDLLPADQQATVGGPTVSSPVTQGATLGERAPSFDLPVLGSTGKSAGLGAYAGELLVLNFWSSTCSICLQEMPALQQVTTDLHGQVAIVGVDVADPRRSSLAFARRLGVTYPLLSDHSGSTASAYRVDALPVTFLISPKGTILARHPGALTAPELEAILDMDDPNLG
jgi:cytochrome oxidase Cu insertion factor (SCO1/SenC/PrrC family)/thiol-disulfide isomerase/thioredoxin